MALQVFRDGTVGQPVGLPILLPGNMPDLKPVENLNKVSNQGMQPLKFLVLNAVIAGHLMGQKLTIGRHLEAPTPKGQGLLEGYQKGARLGDVIRGLSQVESRFLQNTPGFVREESPNSRRAGIPPGCSVNLSAYGGTTVGRPPAERPG